MSRYTVVLVALILALGAAVGQFLGRLAVAIYASTTLIGAGLGALIGMRRERRRP